MTYVSTQQVHHVVLWLKQVNGESNIDGFANFNGLYKQGHRDYSRSTFSHAKGGAWPTQVAQMDTPAWQQWVWEIFHLEIP